MILFPPSCSLSTDDNFRRQKLMTVTKLLSNKKIINNYHDLAEFKHKIIYTEAHKNAPEPLHNLLVLFFEVCLSTLPLEFPLLGIPLSHSHHYDQPYHSLNVYSAERQEYDRNSQMPPSIAQLSQCQFSLNSPSLSKVLQTAAVPKYMKIGKKMYRLLTFKNLWICICNYFLFDQMSFSMQV